METNIDAILIWSSNDCSQNMPLIRCVEKTKKNVMQPNFDKSQLNETALFFLGKNLSKMVGNQMTTRLNAL